MKGFYIAFLFICFSIGAYAQEANKEILRQNIVYVADELKKTEPVKDSVEWNNAGSIGMQVTQASFTNWAAGGENAVAIEVQAQYHSDRKSEKTLWQNRIELAYGLNDTYSQGMRKTSDKIYLNSNFGYKLRDKLYVSVFFEYLTQFAKGYDYKKTETTFLSQFMAPGYMSEGVGVTWVANSHINVVFTPATSRQVFVLDKELSDIGAFGVDKGKKVRNEFGATLKIETHYDIMKNVHLFSRLKLFTDYLDSPLEVIDVNWEVQCNFTVNKFISANITTNLLYNHFAKIQNPDGSLSPARVQFKELLGIGLQCKF